MPKRPSELINGADSSPERSGNQPNTITTLVVMILAGVLVYLFLNRMDWGGDDRRHEDRHEEKDRDDKKQDKVTVKLVTCISCESELTTSLPMRQWLASQTLHPSSRISSGEIPTRTIRPRQCRR